MAILEADMRELIKAETVLEFTAVRALEADTVRDMQKHTRVLLLAAAIYVGVVNYPSVGYDHRALAHEILYHATQDSRLTLGQRPGEIDPNNLQSLRLERRRAHLPATRQYLEALTSS